MTMRSGRIRRELTTRSRMLTRPSPLTSAARLEPAHVLLVELELGGVLDGDDPLVDRMNPEQTLRRVVFPVPVPPRRDWPGQDARLDERGASWVMVPKPIRSET